MSDSRKLEVSKGVLKQRQLVKSNRNEQGDGNQFVSALIGHFHPRHIPRHFRYAFGSLSWLFPDISKALVVDSKHQRTVLKSHFIPVDPGSPGQETAVSEKA